VSAGRPDLARPTTADEAEAARAVDPSATQRDEALKLELSGIDLPTREEFAEALRSAGLKDGSPKFKRRVKQYERLLELRQRVQEGTAKPRDAAEVERLLEQLGEL
jgi:predicted component of type VI protein secretion system